MEEYKHKLREIDSAVAEAGLRFRVLGFRV